MDMDDDTSRNFVSQAIPTRELGQRVGLQSKSLPSTTLETNPKKEPQYDFLYLSLVVRSRERV